MIVNALKAWALACALLVSTHTLAIAADNLPQTMSTPDTPVFPADLDGRWARAIANDRADDFPVLLAEATRAGDAVRRALANHTIDNGKTALMTAAKRGRVDIAESLVDAGAEIDRRTATGGSALMYAALGNRLALLDWLHRRGADLEARGSNGWSALTIAAAKGYTPLLDWLIAHGADVNTPDVYGTTPLMRAIDNGQVACALRLLESEGIDITAQDEADNTALHFASAHHQVAIIERLLGLGAEPDVPNRRGQTARSMSTVAMPPR